MAALPRIPKLTRVRLAGIGLASLGLVLAGCSSDPGPTASPDASASETSISETDVTPDPSVTGTAATVRQAGQKTIESGSARFTATGSTKGDREGSSDTPKATRYSMEGAYDFENKAIQAKMSGAVFGEQGEVEIISINEIAYMKLPSLGGEKWLEAPVPEGTSSNTLADPAETFVDLKNLKDLQEVGPDTVEGVSATKYTGTTRQLKKALAAAGVPVGEGDTGKVSGKSKTSIWIDDEGRIIKVANETKAKSGGLKVESTTSIRFYDLGSDLDIQAPPADQVSSLSDLAANIPQ